MLVTGFENPPSHAICSRVSSLYGLSITAVGDDFTARPRRSGQPLIQSHQRPFQGFREGDIPTSVCAQVMLQFPNPLGERSEWEEFNWQPGHFAGNHSRSILFQLTTVLQPPQRVCSFGQYQFRRRQVTSLECRFGPLSGRPSIYERSNQQGCVDDCTHLRSASSASNIDRTGTSSWPKAWRRSTSSMSSSIDGKEAISSSVCAKNCCIDCPRRAALAASWLRTASGTSRMVICTAMQALYQRCQHMALMATEYWHV